MTMQNAMGDYAQRGGESTANWLRRLIAIRAPEIYLRSATNLLESETKQGNFTIRYFYLELY
jgi:hypothetical protein